MIRFVWVVVSVFGMGYPHAAQNLECFDALLAPCSVDSVAERELLFGLIPSLYAQNSDTLTTAVWRLDGFEKSGYRTPPQPPIYSSTTRCAVRDTLLTTRAIFRTFGLNDTLPLLTHKPFLIGIGGQTPWTPVMVNENTLVFHQYFGYPHGGQTSYEYHNYYIFRRVRMLVE